MLYCDDSLSRLDRLAFGPRTSALLARSTSYDPSRPFGFLQRVWLPLSPPPFPDGSLDSLIVCPWVSSDSLVTHWIDVEFCYFFFFFPCSRPCFVIPVAESKIVVTPHFCEPLSLCCFDQSTLLFISSSSCPDCWTSTIFPLFKLRLCCYSPWSLSSSPCLVPVIL